MKLRLLALACTFFITPLLTAQTPAPQPTPPSTAPAAGMHRVVLKEMGPNKIEAIKIIRNSVPGIGLADAKRLVESAPAFVKDTNAEDALRIQKAFESAGAKVEVTPALPEGTAPPKASHRVVLESFGESKIMTIKVVRDATGLGLADTKKLVESAPVTVKETDEKAAEVLVKALEGAGAKAKSEPLKKE